MKPFFYDILVPKPILKSLIPKLTSLSSDLLFSFLRSYFADLLFYIFKWLVGITQLGDQTTYALMEAMLGEPQKMEHVFLDLIVLALQAELSFLQNHLATMEIRQPPPIPPTQGVPTSTIFSVADLPMVVGVASATLSMPATFDPSSHFDLATAQASWAVYQRAMMDPRQYMAVANPIGPTAGGGVDLQTVARELINRHVPPQAPPQTFGSNAASTSAPSLSSSK
nr:LOB domain-containing protein 18 isoform X2 [Arachis hypogaea]